MRYGKLAAFLTLTAAMATSATAAPQEKKDGKKADVEAAKSFRGEWEVVEHTPIGLPPVTYTLVVFQGDKMTLHSKLDDQKSKAECVFTLDAAAKTIDFKPAGAGKDTKPSRGLYDLKDGQLRLCFRGQNASRPAGFDDKKDGVWSTTFLVLKAKPGV